jgi:hypothetical protein
MNREIALSFEPLRCNFKGQQSKTGNDAAFQCCMCC